MRPRSPALVVLLMMAAVSRAEPNAPESVRWQQAGPYATATLLEDWRHAARDRTVPVKMYFPQDAKGPLAVIIFSHGLGGGRDGYQYLGEFWSSHGYVSVHLQHPGSDHGIFAGGGDPLAAIRAALANHHNAIDRCRDVSFALDRLTEINADAEHRLCGRLDLDRVGMAGHSYGAYTAMTMVGQSVVGPRGMGFSFADRRIKAAVAMSAPAPRNLEQLERIFATVEVPCMHMTGTLDDSPVGETSAEQRRLGYDHCVNSPQYLLTFIGGNHAIFSGRGRGVGGARPDDVFQAWISTAATAFLDAYLRDDAAAKEFLKEDLGDLLRNLAIYETKQLD